MAAPSETEFETFSYFLVPLGTYVTAILAQNAHWASTLWSQRPTQADSESDSVRAGRDWSDELAQPHFTDKETEAKWGVAAQGHTAVRRSKFWNLCDLSELRRIPTRRAPGIKFQRSFCPAS